MNDLINYIKDLPRDVFPIMKQTSEFVNDEENDLNEQTRNSEVMYQKFERMLKHSQKNDLLIKKFPKIIVEILLKSTKNASSATILDNINYIVYTACELGCNSALMFYKSLGIDLSMPYDGNAPIYVACCKGHYDCLDTLIKFGCDTKINDKQGRTLTYIACCNGYDNCLKLLLEKDCDVQIKSKKGLLPADIAGSNVYGG